MTNVKVCDCKLISLALVLLIAVCTFAEAEPSDHESILAQETQIRGYWIDPSTGLMWTAKDNGKDVNWHQATKYCSNLRTAGYSDWKLATIDQLQAIYDNGSHSPGENPKSRWHDAEPMSFHVKGGLFLTGIQWSSSRKLDDRLKPSGYAWRYDFNEGRAFDGDELWFSTDKHALCVRDTKSASPNGPAKTSLWNDSTTGLMWTANDNGHDVSLREAIDYCRHLKTGEYSDWRLATIDELEKLPLPKPNGSDPVSNREKAVAEGPTLTASPWSRSAVNNDSGYPSQYAWYLDIQTGTRVFDDPSFAHDRRALCVRGSVTQPASLKNTSTDPVTSQETQRLGYWIDPSTGLMWAARDNLGNLILYSEATRYCHNLRLAQHSDWRLATTTELQGIYDDNSKSAGESPRSSGHEPEPCFFHVKGGLFLTGMAWGGTSEQEDKNAPTEVSVFDFESGRVVEHLGIVSKNDSLLRNTRALCVRQP